mgnify:CR=1 FL=1
MLNADKKPVSGKQEDENPHVYTSFDRKKKKNQVYDDFTTTTIEKQQQRQRLVRACGRACA